MNFAVYQINKYMQVEQHFVVIIGIIRNYAGLQLYNRLAIVIM